MKTSLSYIHTIQPSILSDLDEAYYILLLPLLAIFSHTSNSVARTLVSPSTLIEAYAAFLALPRPRTLSPATAQLERLCARLSSMDAELMPLLTRALVDVRRRSMSILIHFHIDIIWQSLYLWHMGTVASAGYSVSWHPMKRYVPTISVRKSHGINRFSRRWNHKKWNRYSLETTT